MSINVHLSRLRRIAVSLELRIERRDAARQPVDREREELDTVRWCIDGVEKQIAEQERRTVPRFGAGL